MSGKERKEDGRLFHVSLSNIFESSFLLVIIRPEKSKVKQPPTPPNRIVAGSPTTYRAKPKLALENATEKILDPPALQLTTLFAR